MQFLCFAALLLAQRPLLYHLKATRQPSVQTLVEKRLKLSQIKNKYSFSVVQKLYTNFNDGKSQQGQARHLLQESQGGGLAGEERFQAAANRRGV
jgi:hypothetical protein